MSIYVSPAVLTAQLLLFTAYKFILNSYLRYCVFRNLTESTVHIFVRFLCNLVEHCLTQM